MRISINVTSPPTTALNQGHDPLVTDLLLSTHIMPPYHPDLITEQHLSWHDMRCLVLKGLPDGDGIFRGSSGSGSVEESTR